jgi:glutamate dehydrogenase/leucine dehydrogenase
VASQRAIAKFLWGDEDLGGRHVAVVGVGKVGRNLVGRLRDAGCRVTVSDTYPPAIDWIRENYEDVEIIGPDEVYSVECDILAPCSLGGVLNENTIPQLQCRAIAGAANNQLLTIDDADRLQDREILYAPDFVVNAGGLINVSEEIRGYVVDRAAARIDKIYGNTLRVLEAAAERKESPYVTAVDLAHERMRDIGHLRLFRRSGDDRN